MILVSIASALLNGFALMLLWNWFVVPAFGVPAISMTSAISLAIIASLLTNQYIPKPNGESDKEHQMKRIDHEFTLPIVVIAMGWILRFFR
ncbi:MAG: hypothetical protein UY23_C0006G0047 [Candidatus Jorgensenbacteria bacterium GW2011_GWA1_48_11]|uniref:Uncharacterized protein n=1 Tax=Candidatus Jorgensenbacteria bacterium GW2011_GWA1_48_11 TaxID=1618660 RepID=A0A0G1WKH4_9BACT|nr:MAG: hypothetical protein UY23_C0006G0047 [Candidatus Jorgensenbacteria bacterium GW2011_GWA1_48_11]